MTIKDWLYLGITIASYAIAVIAGVYTKQKSKINRATRAGKIMDVVGQLASYAVHETEYLDLQNDQKREVASEIINQGLTKLGINNVTATVINGAIEKSVNSMHLANLDDPSVTTMTIDKADIMQPSDQLKFYGDDVNE